MTPGDILKANSLTRGTSLGSCSRTYEQHQLLHQEGGRRHLEFRKTVAISLLFDQS